ncbi:MAG: phosphonate C-P lyase system protein PhnH [Desulfuromonadales bacterium]
MTTAAIHRDHAMFRIILQATSHPGKSFAVPVSIENISRHAVLVNMLGCLMDNEVTFAIIGDVDNTLAEAIAFRTCSSVVDISEADFVIVSRGTTDGLLELIKRGTLEYPDMGATLVYLIDDIADQGGTAALSGPGINGTVQPVFSGLAETELTGLCEINTEYPLGVDALFLDNHGRIASIPRSTRIGAH